MSGGGPSRDVPIDVIMRTGGRPFPVLERAVRSLAAQTAGALRLVLVLHGAADVEGARGLLAGALREIAVVEAPGANRARAMAAGLAAVRAPRFAFLDDDDYLLPEHFQRLLEAMEGAPSPALAYADILAVDEGEDGAAPPHLFRQGPAEPPLGRITDRISVHAFLAETAALEGAPFREWDLATAEDALLLAFLLARSTPVHSPHATCVYVQGRGDASAYLDRPDRARDELAFARAAAPLREAIEARFGAPQRLTPAEYLAPFEAAARRADLFAARRVRPAHAPLAAIRDDRQAIPVGDDPLVVSAPLALAGFEAMAGSAVKEGGAYRMTAPEPFAYAARLPVDALSPHRPLTVAVRARCEGAPFGLALAGADHALVAEARLDPLAASVEVQLPWTQAEPPVLVVRRLGGQAGASLHIEAAVTALPVAALSASGSRAQAQAALEALAAAPRRLGSPAGGSEPSAQATPLLDEPTEVALGSAPWAYAHSSPLPPQPGWLAVELGSAASSLFVLRVDEAWNSVGERVEVAPAARPALVLMEALPAGAATRLVLQAGPSPRGERVTLKRILLYPRD